MQNACADDTIEIMTFKSGKFILSSKCNFDEIMPLVVESSVLYRATGDLPILPRIASRLDEDLIMRSIHGTVAIEGNPLAEEQVESILAGKERPIQSSRAVTEILNLKTAYDELLKVSPKNEPLVLTQPYIKEVHRTITKETEYKRNEPGVYRDHRVEVGDLAHGGKYVPPKIRVDIEKILDQFEIWINKDELINMSPFLRAAIAHYYLAAIHPFGDGNGRTARFIEASILSHSGYKYVPKMLSNYYYKNVDDYYTAFRQVEKNKDNDITPFVHFVLRGVISSLDEIKSRITSQIRILAIRDFIKFLRDEGKISRRQFDLLEIMAENPKPFNRRELISSPSFGLLYRKLSEDTLKRDLKKLLELEILIREDNSYRLNFYVLG